jgi:chromosome segregation ATPase
MKPEHTDLAVQLRPYVVLVMVLILGCASSRGSHSGSGSSSSAPSPTPEAPAKPIPKDEVEACEWSLKEAIDEWANANVNYLDYAAERISLELELSQPRSPIRDVEKEKRLEQHRTNSWEVEAQKAVSWWAKEAEARVKRFNEALAKHPDRKSDFNWETYRDQKRADPAWVNAAKKFNAARSRSGAAAEQADQVNLGFEIQTQEREVEYLSQEVQKQQAEVDRLRQRYHDLRSEAEKADGEKGIWRKDVQDAKSELNWAEMELSARQTKLQQAQEVLEQLKAKKRGQK